MIKLYVDLNIQRFKYSTSYEFIYTSKKEGYESGNEKFGTSQSSEDSFNNSFDDLREFITDTIGVKNLLTAKISGTLWSTWENAESLFEGCTSLTEVDLSDLIIGDGRNI